MGSSKNGRRPWAVLWLLGAASFLGTASLAGACNSKPKGRAEGASTAPSASSTAPLASGARRAPKSLVFNVPVGPVFPIEPGIGMGPIRFGATVATIERLMEAPCAEKNASSCRYPIHAVEFELENGVLTKIHIQGHERPATADRKHMFGIFNGKLLNGVELGMYREYVESVMGPAPEGREAGPEPSERGFNLVYVGEYPGIRMEYDKLANGNVVLAGMVVTQAAVSAHPAGQKGKPPGPSKGAPPATSSRPRPRAPLH